jgi:hypothetical protein
MLLKWAVTGFFDIGFGMRQCAAVLRLRVACDVDIRSAFHNFFSASVF